MNWFLIQVRLKTSFATGPIGTRSRAGFSDQSRKIIIHYKDIGYEYNIDVMRQFSCLVINSVAVYS